MPNRWELGKTLDAPPLPKRLELVKIVLAVDLVTIYFAKHSLNFPTKPEVRFGAFPAPVFLEAAARPR